MFIFDPLNMNKDNLLSFIAFILKQLAHNIKFHEKYSLGIH